MDDTESRTRCPKCGHMTPRSEQRCEECNYKYGPVRARLWYHECTCHPELAEARDTQHWLRQHLSVSKANAWHHVDENRVTDYSVEELKRLVDDHDTVIVCKGCGSVKALGGTGGRVDAELA